MKKILATILLVLVSFPCLFAWGNDYKIPATNEVVLVFSFTYRPKVDREFYKVYLAEDDGSYDEDEIKEDIIYSPAMSKWFPKDSKAPLDNIISIRVKINKDRIIKCEYFMWRLFGNRNLSFFLPMGFQINVPKDVRYVYLGHFDYRRKSNIDAEIVDIQRTDRYDDAVKVIKKRYGSDIELVRLPLQKIKEEEK